VRLILAIIILYSYLFIIIIIIIIIITYFNTAEPPTTEYSRVIGGGKCDFLSHVVVISYVYVCVCVCDVLSLVPRRHMQHMLMASNAAAPQPRARTGYGNITYYDRGGLALLLL